MGYCGPCGGWDTHHLGCPLRRTEQRLPGKVTHHQNFSRQIEQWAAQLSSKPVWLYAHKSTRKIGWIYRAKITRKRRRSDDVAEVSTDIFIRQDPHIRYVKWRGIVFFAA